MKRLKNLSLIALSAIATMSFTACSDDDTGPVNNEDILYYGQDVGNFSADEWYPGGRLGTTDNVTAKCYQDETPAVEEAGLISEFNLGEQFFKRNYTLDTPPFKGWGPAASRRACFDCHIAYGGHGRKQTSFSPTYGNGYIIQVFTPDAPGSNNGVAFDGLTTFTQVMAASPFLPPVNPDEIKIEWKTVDAMPSGLAMQFPDNGERFELTYPEVTVPQSAFNTDPKPSENKSVRLLVSLCLSGTGIIDAIPNDSLKKQYQEAAKYAELNPAIWDKAKNDFAETAYQTLGGRKFVKRFNYDLLAGSLQEDVALWDELGVSRSDLPYLCTTDAWARAMANEPSVIENIKSNPTSPYFADTEEGIRERVFNLLSPATNQFDNQWHNFSPEISDDNYHAFMVWHRGLAVPRARNLNDKEVQRGKKLFYEMGCTSCHRPSWTTGDDNYYAPSILDGKQLPRYPKQKIYPYSDFVQHRLYMANDILNEWCRTPPLWGRGLMLINTGAEERLHDCRARNEVEAIMWHAYSKNSDAYTTAEKFYNLKKADRDAVVKFLRSI